MSTRLFKKTLFAAAGMLAVACANDVTGPEENEGLPDNSAVIDTPDFGAQQQDGWDQNLAEREIDYGQALRAAALKLIGELPTLAEIKFVSDAADQKAAYEAMIDAYLEDPRFAGQVRRFFRDTFKMGQGDLDGAPSFAAQLVVENRSFLELLTATSGTCPTMDGATGTFTAAECDSGAPTKAGILTNPDVQRQFFSNMAFRRVRWVQETFACAKFPSEIGESQNLGGALPYTAPWAFESISGSLNGGRVDFHDMSAVTCANCHATMNHQAPLFASFDEDGMWMPDFQVPVPIEGMPIVTREDYLPASETTAWRYGIAAPDLASFGAAMAADPDVSECMVARVWNYAMGKGDIVTALSLVPPSTIGSIVADYQSNGYRLKEVFRQAFTSDDFVKF